MFLKIILDLIIYFIFLFKECSQSCDFWHCCELQRTVSFIFFNQLKGALQGLRRFLPTESPLEMMKNAF